MGARVNVRPARKERHKKSGTKRAARKERHERLRLTKGFGTKGFGTKGFG